MDNKRLTRKEKRILKQNGNINIQEKINFNLKHIEPLTENQKNSFEAYHQNKNLMLHSYQIKFRINEKKFTYRASLPEYFKKMLKTKRLNFQDNLID